MVCSEYFPRRLIYMKTDDLVRDLRVKLDKTVFIEVINRMSRYHSQKISSEGKQKETVEPRTTEDTQPGSVHNNNNNSNDTPETCQSSLKDTQNEGLTVSALFELSIKQQVNGGEESVRQLKNAKLNIVNRYGYGFEDDVFLI